MTFGGNYLKKKIQEGNDFGHMLLLLSPRIPYPPMDLILGIDFVLRNFFKKSQIQGILENSQYQRAVKNSQYRLWRPYMLSLAHYWCGMKNCLGFCIDDGLEYEIMPYLMK